MQENENQMVEREDNALVRVVSEGDPGLMLEVLEKKSQIADRMRALVEHIVVSQTYPEDWTVQGEGDKAKACLSSAGAERIGRSFPIQIGETKMVKEEFEDEFGKAYRYVCSGEAALYERRVYVEGRYSTRDKFLGFAKGEWKPVEDINEGNIRAAAYHTFCGNAIKALLGLRGLPAREYQRIMAGTGRDPAKSSTVTRGQGTEGGTSADDSRHQKELAQICIAIADAAMTVAQNQDGQTWRLIGLSDSDSRESLEVAQDICGKLSSFTNKDGKTVAGKTSAKLLKGKWLSATLGKARLLKSELDQSQPTGDSFPGE